MIVRLSLFATTLSLLAGCHYCPYNRYMPCPGYRYACDDIGIHYGRHHAGRRGGVFWGDAGDQGDCLSGDACASDPYCYYPEPIAPEAPKIEDNEPVEVPADTSDAPSIFTPSGTLPQAPPVEVAPEANESLEPSLLAPDEPSTAIPLFEGRVELNELQPDLPEPQSVPELTAPLVTPSVPQSTEIEAAPEVEEEDEGPGFPRSLFPLEFPPRLFRLRDDDEELEPAPPVSEATQRNRALPIFGRPSVTTPRSTASEASRQRQTVPVAAPDADSSTAGSSVSRFGHSL